MSRVGRSRLVVFILVIAIAGSTTPVIAQSPTLPATAMVAAAADAEPSAVRLHVGRSTLVDMGGPIARVSLTSADVADAMVTASNQLLINGKAPGTISMFVWDRAGAVRRFEVMVQRDLSRLSEQMKQLFPGESIDVQSNGKNVVLSGSVSSKEVAEKAVSVAAGYVSSRDEVVTLLQLQAGAPSNQVLLKVRFAEVSRSALTELGSSLAANGYKDGRWFGRTTTGQFPAPEWDSEGRFVFSDFLNLFLFDAKNQVAGVIKALQTKGLLQTLAEPNLVAESGKEASFLAGGEFPIPIAQGSGANIGVSVVFKEFGIRLNFTPTVNGDRVHLKVRPEVSTLDFNNAVVLDGFRIPALSTRRTETELELQNGQTFAIAGLISNSVRSSLHRIPGIGHIPILGLLFTSKAAQKEQTELVVMITPIILPNNSRGVTNEMPRMPEQYMTPIPENDTHPQPPDAFTPDRAGIARPTASTPTLAPAQAAGLPARAPASSTSAAGSPASAAAAVSALTPSAPRIVAAPNTPNAAPAAGASPAAAPAARPMTESERKALERANREEAERTKRENEALARARAAEEKLEKKRAEEAREQEEKAAREQAKRDAEQAKRDAEQARRDAEEAKKQAEREKEQQKAIDEAAARLKAAEALYSAELAKARKDGQDQ